MYNIDFAVYLTLTQYCKSTVPQLKTRKKASKWKKKTT